MAWSEVRGSLNWAGRLRGTSEEDLPGHTWGFFFFPPPPPPPPPPFFFFFFL
ncbi:hypothetical protein ACRAWF_46590 [Streptomyces sp. L7]